MKMRANSNLAFAHTLETTSLGSYDQDIPPDSASIRHNSWLQIWNGKFSSRSFWRKICNRFLLYHIQNKKGGLSKTITNKSIHTLFNDDKISLNINANIVELFLNFFLHFVHFLSAFSFIILAFASISVSSQLPANYFGSGKRDPASFAVPRRSYGTGYTTR